MPELDATYAFWTSRLRWSVGFCCPSAAFKVSILRPCFRGRTFSLLSSHSNDILGVQVTSSGTGISQNLKTSKAWGYTPARILEQGISDHVENAISPLLPSLLLKTHQTYKLQLCFGPSSTSSRWYPTTTNTHWTPRCMLGMQFFKFSRGNLVVIVHKYVTIPSIHPARPGARPDMHAWGTGRFFTAP